MTAREKLREAVEQLSEDEAEDALRYLATRDADPLLEAIERAPLDDEPTSADEDRTAREAWTDYEQGHSVALHEIRHEFE
jgi:Arc/MetJ-type ribon-helix-helix transcriptional regulator